MRPIPKPLLATVLIALAAVMCVSAQDSRPKFEVVSIKESILPAGYVGGGLVETPPSGRVNIARTTLRMLLQNAYRIQAYQIIGGPDWMYNLRFDIQAKPPDDYQPETVTPCTGLNCSPTKVQSMMQAVLADRFELKTHRETREQPVYELTLAKAGFKLKEVPPPPPRDPNAITPPGPVSFGPLAIPTTRPGVSMATSNYVVGSAVPFGTLVSMLAGILGRPVIDRTGIQGYYDFRVAFSRDGTPDDPRPSIFTALQDELGLKLESARGPVEVLVIDSVSKPSEN